MGAGDHGGDQPDGVPVTKRSDQTQAGPEVLYVGRPGSGRSLPVGEPRPTRLRGSGRAAVKLVTAALAGALIVDRIRRFGLPVDPHPHSHPDPAGQ